MNNGGQQPLLLIVNHPAPRPGSAEAAMTNPIPPEQYPYYATIIRSGQMSHADAVRLVESDRGFEAWYIERYNDVTPRSRQPNSPD
jgi:hypothetical protein